MNDYSLMCLTGIRITGVKAEYVTGYASNVTHQVSLEGLGSLLLSRKHAIALRDQLDASLRAEASETAIATGRAMWTEATA